jgi:amidase
VTGFDEYSNYDGLGLAELVHRKQVSPAMLLAEAIYRVERLNPTINAIVTEMYDLAKSTIENGLPEGVFTGVPFLLKDINMAYAGVALTNGSQFFIDNVPDHDSELVSRYKKGGLVIFGKTNTPELGINYSTEPRLFGPTRNPWNTDYSPGGSSGGSAAAVAAGIVPVAHGRDGGGSIRVPASCCGLFGLKPTRGRNPKGPDFGEGWSGMSVEHVVSRTVRDSAAMLDLTAGPDIGAPYWAIPPTRPFIEEVGVDVGQLRVAYSTKAPSGVPVDAECTKATGDAAKLLVELGHHVEEDAPRFDVEAFSNAFRVIVVANTAAAINQHALNIGREAGPQDFENITWMLSQLGNTIPAADYAAALQTIHRVGRQVGRFFDNYDLLVTPTLAKPPLLLGTLDTMTNDPMEYSIKLAGFAAFTSLFNASGNPAMSVPLHWTSDNLPVGVQFVGRYGDEGILFRLAAQLEQARPWLNRCAPLYA